jgi:hypothetical protein
VARWDARGVRYVHAPVFMAPTNCAEDGGQTLAMVPALAKLLDEGIQRGEGHLDVAAGVLQSHECVPGPPLERT